MAATPLRSTAPPWLRWGCGEGVLRSRPARGGFRVGALPVALDTLALMAKAKGESTTETRVRCPNCGAARPAELAATVPRPPCPKCGAKGIAIELGIATELDLAAEIRAAIRPVDQSRGWERRWADIEAELQRLLAPRGGVLSGKAVHEAQRELLSFYVHAYHLKDALKAEAGALGIGKAEVEAAINAEPALALLADLANLDKHSKLTNPPRSGHVPKVGEVQGSQAGSGAGGWRLEQVIEHNGQSLDGLSVAEDAVAAWGRWLTKWGLLPTP